MRICRSQDTAPTSPRQRRAHRTSPLSRRAGRFNALWALFGGGVAVIAVSVSLLSMPAPGRAPERQTLRMYCAAGLRVPVEEMATEYEGRYGVPIELQFGGSNTLLNQLQIDRYGNADLYLAADDFYSDKAIEEGLAEERLPIAWMEPVIAVPEDNPQGIRSIRDLLHEDIRVSLGNPDQAAIGRAVRKRLQRHPAGEGTLWTQLKEHVSDNGVFKPTVNDVANDVVIGTVDAAIVWDSTIAMPKYADDLQAISVEELSANPSLISVCVLKSSGEPAEALRFARYLTDRDRGLPVFEKYGMRPFDREARDEKRESASGRGMVDRQPVAQAIGKEVPDGWKVLPDGNSPEADSAETAAGITSEGTGNGKQ